MKRTLLTTAAALTIVTVISKVFGLFREITLAFLFGTTLEMDAYLVALIIPVIIFESFGEAIRLSFVPVIADYLNDGRNLWRVFNNLVNCIFVITALISTAGVLIVPHIIPYLPFGFDQNTTHLVAYLTQISMFIIVFSSLAPISIGLLNLKNKFVYPELTGVVYSVVLITFAFLGKKFWGITGLAVGAVAAEMMKFVFLLPALYKEGYRYRLYINLGDPALGRLVGMMMPMIFGNILSRLNVLAERVVGSYLLPGSISALNYAKKFLLLCTGLIESIAITLVYPALTKCFVAGKMKKYNWLLSRTVIILVIVLLPISVGLIVLGEPIVSLFFRRGVFDQHAVAMTSGALLFYSLGILGSVIQSLLERGFFAIKDSKTAVVCNSIGIVLNLILIMVLPIYLGYKGIALAESIALSAAAVLLLAGICRKVGYLGTKRTLLVSLKAFAASCVMGLEVYYLNQVLEFNEILKLLTMVISGFASYVILILVLGVERIRTWKRFFTNKALY